MIPVLRVREPKLFNQNCRLPGKVWLQGNAIDPPKDLWSQFEPELRSAFKERCGWLAMWIPKGQVDHYLSKGHPNPAIRRRQRRLAYEWNNLRYADGEVNNLKRNRDARILDPFEVGVGWFRLNKALELEVTGVCPPNQVARAQFTIEKLGLDCGKAVMRHRKHMLDTYQSQIAAGMDPVAALAILERDAPLIAEYVRTP